MPRSAPGPATLCPATRTSPDVGLSRPAMMRRRVDLPQPEGPTRQTNSRRLTVSETSRNASTSSPLSESTKVFPTWQPTRISSSSPGLTALIKFSMATNWSHRIISVASKFRSRDLYIPSFVTEIGELARSVLRGYGVKSVLQCPQARLAVSYLYQCD